MFKLLSCLALTTCLATPSAAQCSDLTITGAIASGATITFDVSGAPADAPTVFLMALETGTFSAALPFGTLNLGILPPFAPFGNLTTDANGDGSFSLTLPNVPATPPAVSFDLYFQALSVGISIPTGPPTGGGFPFSLTLCESDVESLSVGS